MNLYGTDELGDVFLDGRKLRREAGPDAIFKRFLARVDSDVQILLEVIRSFRKV